MTRPWDSLLPGEEPALDLMPMAARRALDRAGRKLSLVAWQGLPLEARAALVELGASPEVDVPRVLGLIAPATPSAQPMAPREDASLVAPPESIACDAAAWRALGPVARHALASYAARGRHEKAEALLRELTSPG